MTKDYKDFRARNNPRGRRGHRGSGFFWFVTGAVVGAFAVALAWTLQEAEQSAPLPPPETASAAPGQAAAKPRFDFYNILPEMEVVVPEKDLAAKPPPPPKPRPPKQPETAPESAEPVSQQAPNPAPAKPAGNEPASGGGTSYLLQVASYRSAAEAERLKAQLALLGIQARVQQVTINGKDTYHRVRAGPYRGKDSTNAARDLLTRNGLESIAIKVK
jgi:cell division protein FtsN